jgi:hypothetical protein
LKLYVNSTLKYEEKPNYRASQPGDGGVLSWEEGLGKG